MRKDTYLEVDLKKLEYNIRNIMKCVAPKEVLPVIKADAYGMGVKNIVNIINNIGIKTACVALVAEGIELKEAKFLGDVLVINPCMIGEIEEAIKYDLILGTSIKEQIIEIDRQGKKYSKVVKIHLEIETGMNRTGIRLSDLKEYIMLCKELKNIEIQGAYTHFATSDEKDSDYMYSQVDVFKQAINILHENNIFPKYIHMQNSGGVFQIKDDNFTTAVRPGIIIYGHNINEEFTNIIDIKPVSRLISKVSLIKEIEKDDTPYAISGYKKIATIPIGYADGLPRSLSNKGSVVINGNICNIVGNVLMDNILVDVTNLDEVQVGDIVYIWDNENITVEDVASKANTINYEIVSRISPRIERRYV